MDLGSLMPLPRLRTVCGVGYDVAACPTLGLLVTSNCEDNSLSVYRLPTSVASSMCQERGESGLALMCTLGVVTQMRFQFEVEDGYSGNVSGYLAFTGPATCRHLIVTDAGHDAVHVIDVPGRAHVGYVAAPGTIAGPRGVAARGSLVAVSAWKSDAFGDHVVQLFEGSGATWTPVRVLAGGFGRPGRADGQLCMPYGLRFTVDGTVLVVADNFNDRVCAFRVEDGSFVGHVATGLKDPMDVEECQGGWLVACERWHSVEFVGSGRGGVGPVGAGADAHHRVPCQTALGTRGRRGSEDGELNCPIALAMVPDLGLVVLDEDGLQVFDTPDIRAMAAMSALRVAWMVAAARAVARRCA